VRATYCCFRKNRFLDALICLDQASLAQASVEDRGNFGAMLDYFDRLTLIAITSGSLFPRLAMLCFVFHSRHFRGDGRDMLSRCTNPTTKKSNTSPMQLAGKELKKSNTLPAHTVGKKEGTISRSGTTTSFYSD
jgi:hypothetical protein